MTHVETVTVTRSRTELATALSAAPGPIGVVMTMGALHEGHAQLLRQARLRCATVVATIFVNPLQFGPGEDLDRYPRSFDADVAVCIEQQTDIVFAPSLEEMYPFGAPAVTINPGPLADLYEGASRPGHFAGVLTVVNKLLHLTQAEVAFFGEKDYQQLTLIRQLVKDAELPVEIIGVPIVREHDGLARSSRNIYLSAAERHQALGLSRALRAAAQFPHSAIVSARRVLGEHGITPDYVALTDMELGTPPATGEARLLIAAKVGSTRLIDNAPVRLGATHATDNVEVQNSSSRRHTS